MNEQIINYEALKQQINKRQKEIQLNNMVNSIFGMEVDKKSFIYALIALGITNTPKMVKTCMRAIEKDKKDKSYYDRGLNKRLPLKRKLKNEDIAVIKYRQSKGEKLYFILQDMELLK